MAEGTEYRVYKLDIKSFFESVNKALIKKCLQQPHLSTHTQNILLGYLSHFPDLLPRGLEFSPIIAELILKNFDKEIKRGNDVIYYSRFVDDILLITTKSEDKKSFLKKISSTLPEGITLNYNKTKIIDVENRSAGSNNPVAAFNYLGYKFEVQDYQISSKQKNARYRKVIVDLSDFKVKQFESKLCKALVNYCNTGDFDLLNSRIKFLTTNRDLVQKSTGNKIPTGIYYNYSLIDPNSCALNRLDESLRKFVMSYDNLFHKPGTPTLSLNQKRRLLQSSFKSGFKNRIYKKFTPYWLKEITRVWL
ncbi:antiviral reverse transcriptase Drt3a [Catenovulum maritimum]|uniref:antiviral reverse transcriptase Drt3a n=1 Tax=Catenovulum maritimum TaxID=1513271 RepID=UPI00065FAE9F|nr:antiviral reverse transcriptase Drt3a [Catenovulum maritimum]